MRTITTTFLVLLTGFVFAQNSQVRELPEFDAITLSVSGTVYITQASTQRVELKGSNETLDKIETEVRNGRLIIKSEDSNSWFSWRDTGDFDVYISVKELNKIHVAGSGRVYTENKITSKDLELDVSGSGKMEVQAEATYLDANISGSGKIEIEGKTKDLEVRISGSGDIYADKLMSENCEARISGSGKCEVNVSNSIDARISGSGSVYYRGNPNHVDSSTSGSGRVKKIS
ncbi:head GIN domain-containing protein [Fulvivirga lutea]|uniref:DUF2807 domain-containing protein n=1 Tax=Fulvivirga lutea TaxID=2810512 RepID=A0A974WGZ4_9BACT|nr:head GIN domain-containing protein [Fulvivirga lutea]QSE97699.1 DUF2807 domain-containing protein [Fulvivirga lutea]